MTMLSLDAVRDARWLTRQRVLRWSFGLVAMSLILIGAHVIDHTRTGLINGSGEQLGVDFINYWSGARFGANGEAARAYDLVAFDEFQRSVVGAGAQFKWYVYPPVATLLSLPLAALPFVSALVVWVLLGAGFCLWSLSGVLGWRWAALATCGAPAACLNLLTGQNGYFTASLLGTGLTLLERRPVLAGILFGLLTYKPHFGVLLPLALILGGYWRTVAAAAITAGALLAISLVLFGSDAWLGFFHHVVLERHVMEMVEWGGHRMPTVFVALRLAGAGNPQAYAAQIASAAVAATAVTMVWRAQCAHELKAATLLIATFLVLPYALDYDMVVLLFAAGWMLDQALRREFLPWERLTLALLLVLPYVAMPLAKETGVQIGPLVLWASLALTARRALARDSTVVPVESVSSRVSLSS